MISEFLVFHKLFVQISGMVAQHIKLDFYLDKDDAEEFFLGYGSLVSIEYGAVTNGINYM